MGGISRSFVVKFEKYGFFVGNVALDLKSTTTDIEKIVIDIK